MNKSNFILLKNFEVPLPVFQLSREWGMMLNEYIHYSFFDGVQRDNEQTIGFWMHGNTILSDDATSSIKSVDWGENVAHELDGKFIHTSYVHFERQNVLNGKTTKWKMTKGNMAGGSTDIILEKGGEGEIDMM